jgi:hypothetical protein
MGIADNVVNPIHVTMLATEIDVRNKVMGKVLKLPDLTKKSSELMTITPEMAVEMLGTQVANRPISAKSVTEMARDMRNGNWRVTGASISFDYDGHLIDGQHRLEACKKAAKPFETFVTTGLEPRAQDNTDRGRRRTFAHQLAIRGEKSANTLAAIVNAYHQYKSGRLGTYDFPTIDEAVELFESDLEGFRNANKASGALTGPPLGVKTKVSGLLIYVLSKINEEDAFVFFQTIAEGTNVDLYNPMYIARGLLLKEANSNTKHSDKWVIACLIKAWNAYRNQSQIKILTWGANERFPEPL